MNVRTRIVVEGRVQGVGYRDFVDRVATELGLIGQIQNLPDKSVEIVCEGAEDTIKKFLGLIKVNKYPIKVSGIKTEYSKSTGEFTGFNVIWEEDLQKAVFERMGLASIYLQELGEKVDGVGNEVKVLRTETDKNLQELGEKVDGVGNEVKALRTETNNNFDRMDNKYDKVTLILTEVVKNQEIQTEKLMKNQEIHSEKLMKNQEIQTEKLMKNQEIHSEKLIGELRKDREELVKAILTVAESKKDL